MCPGCVHFMQFPRLNDFLNPQQDLSSKLWHLEESLQQEIHKQCKVGKVHKKPPLCHTRSRLALRTIYVPAIHGILTRRLNQPNLIQRRCDRFSYSNFGPNREWDKQKSLYDTFGKSPKMSNWLLILFPSIQILLNAEHDQWSSWQNMRISHLQASPIAINRNKLHKFLFFMYNAAQSGIFKHSMFQARNDTFEIKDNHEICRYFCVNGAYSAMLSTSHIFAYDLRLIFIVWIN